MSKSESSISRREADDRLIDDRQASELCSSGTEQASRKTPQRSAATDSSITRLPLRNRQSCHEGEGADNKECGQHK